MDKGNTILGEAQPLKADFIPENNVLIGKQISSQIPGSIPTRFYIQKLVWQVETNRNTNTLLQEAIDNSKIRSSSEAHIT